MTTAESNFRFRCYRTPESCGPSGAAPHLNRKISANTRTLERDRPRLKSTSGDHALAGQPTNDILRREIAKFAKAEGFFSIWMTVFADDTDMRHLLIKAFPGTRDSGCFDPITAAPVSPAPNHDALPHGGKI